MSIGGHLRELRNRLFKAVLAIVTVTAVVAIWAYGPVSNFITRPYCEIDPKHRVALNGGGRSCQLIYTGVTDAFTFRLKIALLAGLILSAPVWLYQLWAFIAPGLHRRERRYTYLFTATASVLFALGAVLAYLTMSKGLELLLSVGGQHLAALLEVNKYFGYFVAMVLIFGVGFEFPLIVVSLNLVGILSSGRLRRSRRVVWFLIVLFAAVATPSQDPFTMLALALPIIGLYEVAVVIARVHDGRKARREADTPWRDLADDVASDLDIETRPAPHASPAPLVHAGRSGDDIT